MKRTLLVLLACLASGCAWGQAGYDGGDSFDNRGEAQITPSTIGSLHEVWRFAAGAAVLGGGYVFDSLNDPNPFVRHALVAHREAGCTGTGVPTCAEAWHLDGRFSPPVTDGTSVFVVDQTDNRLRALAVDGTPRWTYTPSAVAGSTSTLGSVLRIDGGRLWLQVQDTDAGGTRHDRLVSVPTGGCDAPTCSATVTIPGDALSSFIAADGLVLASRRDTPTASHVYAYDATTGTPRWRSSEAATIAAARDGRAYARLACASRGCAPGAVYNLRPGAGCSGTPVVCTAIAGIARMAHGPILTTNHVVAVDDGGQLAWYSNSCNVAACPQTAIFDTPEIPQAFGFAGAGGVVFTAGPVGVGGPWRIWAVDGALTNCPGGSCGPAWVTAPPAGVHGLVVSGGRLYAAEDDGFVHVYGL